MSLENATLTQLQELLRTGQLGARELVQWTLDRIERLDPAIRAFLDVVSEQALQAAARTDQRRPTDWGQAPLAGIPIALKDNLCTAGWKTTCASRMLAHFVPPYDATAVARLKQAGAILIGKTNLDEFAMGSSTENSAFGPTANPWDLKRSPGGSSGGSAAAVAARMVPGALGSDTGGSIRQPAAFCGICGLKPTYGRVSRYGLVAFASSLDQVGPMARSAEDLAVLLQVIAGHDRRDSTSVPHPVPDYRAALREKPSIRLGLLVDQLSQGTDGEIVEAVEGAASHLQRLGFPLQSVRLPHSRYAIATYYIVAPSEASSNLARYDGAHFGYRAELPEGATLEMMYCRTRAQGFGAEVQRRILLGTFALSAGYYDAYYLKALRVRRRIRQDFDEAFNQVDVLLGPTTPTPPFHLGEKSHDPLAMYLQDLFTVSANLAGLPALSIPCGMTASGLPVGLQLIGRPMEEGTLLQLAHCFQQETDWHLRAPDEP